MSKWEVVLDAPDKHTLPHSTGDYLLTFTKNFEQITETCVMDLNEFPDHCAVTFK